MSSETTQLTKASGYDTKNMIFSAPQAGSIPNTPINYKRITISTKNPDGTIGELIIPTTKLFSFGVGENTNPDTGKVNGYVMPICLWNKDGASPEEKAFTDTFDAIIDRCKEHLVSNREEIEQYDLALSDLKKFNPLYWKRDKGKIVDGTGPTMYAKLIMSKKHNKIVSMFYDPSGDEVDPISLSGKYCFVNAAIKFESIFIGNKISMQIKLYECEVKLADSGMKRLMQRPKAQEGVSEATSSLPLNSQTENKDDNDDDDNTPVKAQAPITENKITTAPKKRVVKKVVQKQNEIEDD